MVVVVSPKNNYDFNELRGYDVKIDRRTGNIHHKDGSNPTEVVFEIYETINRKEKMEQIKKCGKKR